LVTGHKKRSQEFNTKTSDTETSVPDMSSVFLPIEEYLPHRGRMVLLDRVLEAGAGRILCTVTLRPESPFCREGQVPAYVGIEYMAQAIGALVGWHSRNQGESVRTGFLVSTRRFTSQVDGFRVGDTLTVEARENWRDEEGLGVMDCTIYHPADVPVAEARLVVYQPKDLNAYLATA
jgi:predicted hotdog family 3-hydroxylacyl-ACP dehydratase